MIAWVLGSDKMRLSLLRNTFIRIAFCLQTIHTAKVCILYIQ